MRKGPKCNMKQKVSEICRFMTALMVLCWGAVFFCALDAVAHAHEVVNCHVDYGDWYFQGNRDGIRVSLLSDLYLYRPSVQMGNNERGHTVVMGMFFRPGSEEAFACGGEYSWSMYGDDPTRYGDVYWNIEYENGGSDARSLVELPGNTGMWANDEAYIMAEMLYYIGTGQKFFGNCDPYSAVMGYSDGKAYNHFTQDLYDRCDGK